MSLSVSRRGFSCRCSSSFNSFITLLPRWIMHEAACCLGDTAGSSLLCVVLVKNTSADLLHLFPPPPNLPSNHLWVTQSSPAVMESWLFWTSWWRWRGLAVIGHVRASTDKLLSVGVHMSACLPLLLIHSASFLVIYPPSYVKWLCVATSIHPMPTNSRARRSKAGKHTEHESPGLPSSHFHRHISYQLAFGVSTRPGD